MNSIISGLEAKCARRQAKSELAQSFDKIESDFWEKENTIPLKQRISDFVKECKKIVTTVAVQLPNSPKRIEVRFRVHQTV